MEPEKMIQEKLLEVTKGYALVMLKMVVRREKPFILLPMHLIHVEMIIQMGTAIFYLIEQLYLMEAEYPMEQIWLYSQKFKWVNHILVRMVEILESLPKVLIQLKD